MAQKYTVLQKVALTFAGICAVAIIAMIAAFGGSEKKPAANPVRDAEMTNIRLERMAREFVTSGLKDPSSAQFRNQRGMCGEVNAKNSFGAYTGFRRFVAGSKELTFIEGEGETPGNAFQKIWEGAC